MSISPNTSTKADAIDALMNSEDSLTRDLGFTLAKFQSAEDRINSVLSGCYLNEDISDAIAEMVKDHIASELLHLKCSVLEVQVARATSNIKG